MDASRASYRLATGEMVFTSPLRLNGSRRTLIAARATLAFGEGTSESTFRGDGPVLAWSGGPGRRWQLAAAGVDATFAGEPPEPRSFVARGPVSLVYSQALAGRNRRSRLQASRLLWEPTGERAEGRHRLRAGPGFDLESGRPGGVDEYRVSGQWLEVLEDGEGAPVALRAWKEIHIEEPEGAAAEGHELRWERQQPGRVVLHGEPARAWRAGNLIEAPRLVFERQREVLIGEGGALTEIASMHEDDGSLFEGDEPVRVRCNRVEMPRKEAGLIVFEGSVQAWQAAASLRARRLVIDQPGRKLRATGGTHLRLESRRKSPGGGEETKTIRVQGDALSYAAGSREAVIEGHASYEEPGGQIVRAERITILRGRPGGVERMEARGRVRLVAPKAHGGGDLLLWEGGAQGVVILRGIEALARLALPPGKMIEAEEIRYDLGTGEVSTAGRAVFQGAEGNEKKGDEP
ncbi:MAG: LptA/OstA family protein [Acidobacteriota bacterium]|nr:LptA/OstA family protein [Acidobacteriota bacterium]